MSTRLPTEQWDNAQEPDIASAPAAPLRHLGESSRYSAVAPFVLFSRRRRSTLADSGQIEGSRTIDMEDSSL